MFTLILLALFFLETPATVTYIQAHQALQHHIQITQNVVKKEEAYRVYADTIAPQVPSDKPLIFVVPLNGMPFDTNHPSYKNALISLEILKQIPVEKKYLLLSEGHTGVPCTSGSEITASFLQLEEGVKTPENVTLLLERKAKTTSENILFSKEIISKKFPDEDVYIILSGFSDVNPGFGIDIGHGARAYMLAAQTWNSNHIHLVGIIPTNQIDTSIPVYGHTYNLTTMVLGATGALYLPLFDRNKQDLQIEQCSTGI